jgi:hypothetical protein
VLLFQEAKAFNFKLSKVCLVTVICLFALQFGHKCWCSLSIFYISLSSCGFFCLFVLGDPGFWVFSHWSLNLALCSCKCCIIKPYPQSLWRIFIFIFLKLSLYWNQEEIGNNVLCLPRCPDYFSKSCFETRTSKTVENLPKVCSCNWNKNLISQWLMKPWIHHSSYMYMLQTRGPSPPWRNTPAHFFILFVFYFIYFILPCCGLNSRPTSWATP